MCLLVDHTKDDSWVQYLRRGLHLQRFDPSQRLREPRIWIYTSYYHNYIDDDYDNDNDVDLLISTVISKVGESLIF